MSTAPLFVVGPPRAGTTLTAGILGGHSAVYMSKELLFFQAVYARRGKLGDPATDPDANARIVEALRPLLSPRKKPGRPAPKTLLDEPEVLQRLRGARSYREILATVMETRMTQAGKRRWGNQVPADVFDLEHIFALFPDARVVACIRDPRDFLVSYRNLWQRPARAGVTDKSDYLRKSYHPVLAALLWRGAARAVERALARWGERVLLNPYEVLAGDAEAQARRLCDFIGEDFEPAMLQVGKSNSSRGQTTRGVIYGDSIGQWRDVLSDSEIGVCQMICRREMARFGYAGAAVRAGALSLAGTLLTSPFYALRGALLRGALGVPLVPYFLRRALRAGR